MTEDDFFSKTQCDRDGEPLTGRTLSWFNDDVLCTQCMMREEELKDVLRDKGVDVGALEGCGYLPNPEDC